jgi:hypothetical protein
MTDHGINIITDGAKDALDEKRDSSARITLPKSLVGMRTAILNAGSM